MLTLIIRAYRKCYRALFRLLYKSEFQELGRGVYIMRPFRLDGSGCVSIGMNSTIQRDAWIYCCGVNGRKATLKIGEGCVFGYRNHITSVSKVVIGNNVLTANNVYISDNIHDYEDTSIPIIKQKILFKRAVEIGDGCWIGENACIIGAHIGKNSVIGANAVVTSDIPDYSVAVGIPAKVIKKYNKEQSKWEIVNTSQNSDSKL